MMTRDDRFYAFIVSRTSRSRAHIRRIRIHKRWLKVSAVGLFALACGLVYGFYGLTQQAAHLRIEHENSRLRAENDKQRQALQNLNNRVDAVEDTSRKLAEESGVQKETPKVHGQGGPAHPVDSAAALAALESKTAKIERDLRNYEDFLRRHGIAPSMPSIWPVVGKLESGLGGRRNPFGGRRYEYHEGQDIDAAYGTPVQVAATGKVTIAGWQRGYGNVVYVDHGNGLSTRYGHLSKIEVRVGDPVTRGQNIGLVGSTGRSTGPHLHYEVRINNQPVNPKQYLPGAEN
jgi:murein DD-endopeptidase MepM/ murein hydrolase activator NlpD